MQIFISRTLLWFYQRTFIQVAQKTLLSLFPFVLLATFARIIAQSVFFEHGFISQVFSVSSWLPFYTNIGVFFSNFSAIIGGLAGLLTAYFSAKYTAEYYHRNSEIAGITGFIFSLIINSRELFSTEIDDGLLTRVNLPSTINIIVAVFIGYLVGQIFRLVDRQCEPSTEDFDADPKRLRPIFLSLFVAILLNTVLYIGSLYNIFTIINNFFATVITSSSSLFTAFATAFLTSLLAWIGMSSAYQTGSIVEDSYSLENLTYALQNHTTQNIPHPYTEATLYHGFGAFGGVGSLLALILAIWGFLFCLISFISFPSYWHLLSICSLLILL